MPALQPYTIADTILRSHRAAMGFAQKLLKDIPAEQFAHCPAPGMNSPAFIIGHLSLYPNHALTLMERSDLVVERPGLSDLFKAGQPSIANDERYPGRDELVTYFDDRNKAIARALEECDDDVLARDVPAEGFFRENFGSVAASVNFLLGGHAMTHLGQLSAWRRIVGMKHAM